MDNFDDLRQQTWDQSVQLQSEAAGSQFAELVRTIAMLRHPTRGCPWDLEQDLRSLRRFMLEEAYEAVEAMAGHNDAHLAEELGDVLLQVVLNAQVAKDSGRSDICQVIVAIQNKMLRRHPHVFGDLVGSGISSSEVKDNWEKIKTNEKPAQQESSYLADCIKTIPALAQAYKIGKKVGKIGFDWSSSSEVLAQVGLELVELEEEMVANDPERLYDELGDVFFSLAQLCRHLGIDPEIAAQQGNAKFLRRFGSMEEIARNRGERITDLERGKLEILWKEAKKSENK